MPIPVLMPRSTSEPVLSGKLLRLLAPVSLRWPTRLTWPMAKVATSQPEADATSRQLSMLARLQPLVLLPPLVALRPSTLVALPPRTLVRLDPSTLVPPPPSMLVPLVPPPPSMLVPLLPLLVPSTLVTPVQQCIMIPPKRLARA
jgi:hypothetical protein